MRILVVTPWFPTSDAPSSGLFVRREAEALAACHEVVVLHLDWQRRSGAPLPTDGYRSARLPLHRLDPLAYVRARRAVRAAAATADVVHTHALTGLIPWLIGRPSTRPWVHSEHWSALPAPQTLGAPARAALRVLRRLLTRPDVVIAESERLAAAVRATRRGETVVVPCVVETVPVRGWPPAVPLKLVGVGGLIARKGPLLAVEALAELIVRGVDAELTWVGDGPQRAAVAERAAREDLHGRVHLLGNVDPAAVRTALDDAHLLLLPTQGDNFCVAAAEALTHGRPIVSGADTGARDYTAPRVGEFVAVQTASAYADAVQRVRERAAGLRPEDVAATVAGRFTPEAVRRALGAIYRRVTAL
ncbi:glycosyltransferase [Microbacterium sp. dk485]|uniref:glycosyltransferase family 4 protein n=1 Tax=Microbacterium sp. dk485 TaxID=2560021 RepID=UPI001074977F|nr:glycosyltransferase family 4 protein [Microbacterium sp. dk485]TFV83796.1 glycosyltransferase [Microbacterium sp. dk485]